MKPKPSLWFVVGTAVAVVLIAGAALLLVSSTRSAKKVRQQLEQRRLELTTMYRANPFPSAENAQQENENTDELTKWYKTLVASASKGQLNVDERRPTAFMSQVGKVRQDLATGVGSNMVARARKDDVDFAFGFDRYFLPNSPLPPPEHVARLMEQLLIVESLCQALFAENIIVLRALHREILEGAVTLQGGGPREPLINPDAGLLKGEALFAKFHFRLEIDATESALLGVLNRLARHDLFVVVTQVQMKKTGPDILSVESAERAAAQDPLAVELLPSESLSRDQRLVCGLPVENPMQVVLDVDVYRFQTGESP